MVQSFLNCSAASQSIQYGGLSPWWQPRLGQRIPHQCRESPVAFKAAMVAVFRAIKNPRFSETRHSPYPVPTNEETA